MGAALAAGAGLGLGLFHGRPPAIAQGTSLHVLACTHPIKQADVLMREELLPAFKRATGIAVTYETIDGNAIPARARAAIGSGRGPDIFQLRWNEPHLFAAGLAEHDALATELGVARQYAFLRDAAGVEGVMRGVPYYGIGNGTAYRTDVFADAGVRKVPETWEEYLDAGRRLKRFGMPVGQSLAHTDSDAAAFAYPLLWSFGGQEVDEQGRVAIDSRGTLFACEFLREFWAEACDESGGAWDDASNDRALFAETIGATLSDAGLYLAARADPEQAPPGLADKMGHFLNPLGPNGRYHAILPVTHSIARYSPQREAGAELIRFLMRPDIYERTLLVQRGYGLGATPSWERHRFWQRDPVREPLRLGARYARSFGWPGPFGAAASEVHSKHIVVDLFARVSQGESSRSSIAQAERELRQVYGRS